MPRTVAAELPALFVPESNASLSEERLEELRAGFAERGWHKGGLLKLLNLYICENLSLVKKRDHISRIWQYSAYKKRFFAQIWRQMRD